MDNHSTDGSLAHFETEWPEIELVKLGSNTGFARASNIGVEKSEGCVWIALLNPDAVPEPTWLETLMRAAEQNTEFSFFGTRMLDFHDPSKLDGTGDVYHVCGLAWREHHGKPSADFGLKDREVFGPCGASALYRRKDYLEAGGFDESFFMYFEDVDLAFRLRLKGHRCMYIANAVVSHVGSAYSGKRSPFSIYHGHRNRIWTYFKNMPARMLLKYLPQLLLSCIASLLWFSLQGKAGAIWKAKWDALINLPKFVRARKTIQACRTVSNQDLLRVMGKGWLDPYRNKL